MIPKGLFSQILLIVVSAVIIATYIRPVFDEISGMQDDILSFQKEQEKVSSVNKSLALLVSKYEGVSNVDKRRLHAYLPDDVDEISVFRELTFIVEESGLLYKDVSYKDENSQKKSSSKATDQVNQPNPHNFNLSVEGTYGQIKNLFNLLEKNIYPLEVQSVSLTRLEGDFLSADIALVTYSYQPLDVDDQVNF